jgi:hypothetical protein
MSGMFRTAVVCFALISCAAPPPTAAEVRAEVEAEVDVARRLMLLEAHVHRNPNSADAALWLARAYRDQGDDRAAEEFQRAIALDERHAIARVEYGYSLVEPDLRRGRQPEPETLAEARRWVEAAYAIEPTCDRRHDLIGLLDLAAGTPSVADRSLVESGLAACPEERWQRAWSATLGRMLRSSGERAEAEVRLCRAVALGNAGALSACQELAGDASCAHVREGSEKVKGKATLSDAFAAALAACGSSTGTTRGTLPG